MKNAALSLTNADRSAYVNSCNMLEPIGVPLEFAVRDYVEIVRILGKRSPIEAAKYYAAKHPANMVRQNRMKRVRSVRDCRREGV